MHKRLLSIYHLIITLLAICIIACLCSFNNSVFAVAKKPQTQVQDQTETDEDWFESEDNDIESMDTDEE